MLLFRASLALLLTAAVILAPAFAVPTTHSTHKKTTATHARAHKTSNTAKGKKSHKLHGQQAIDAERVTEIQQALIREHYLNGEASGQWDSATTSAMQKFQSDQGWQTKLMPDSRALKKLGLGPDYSGAINASGNSSVTEPQPANNIPSTQAAVFAEASGVKE
jgi:peptidoglycan hydrolase-like protein with peptidoglycan-binding domain